MPLQKTKVVKDEESDRDELEPESEPEAPKKTVKKPIKLTKEKSEVRPTTRIDASLSLNFRLGRGH
jgi:hypothetical protein